MKKGEGTVQKKEAKAVLFDMDGVLINSSNAWFGAFNDVLVHFGLKPISKRKFSGIFGNPIEKDKEMFFKNQSIKEIESAFNHFFKKWKCYAVLFKDSIPVLKNLRAKKVRIGLITNATSEIVNTNLKQFKMKKFFGAVVTMDDVKRRKPAPDMILKACKILKVEPKNTILVGDTKNDMIAGKRAGCITVGYKIKGDYCINSLIEIEKFIYV